MTMKKTYLVPECEAFKLHTIQPLAASPEDVTISDDYSDEGGFSKQWKGSIFEDENPFD